MFQKSGATYASRPIRLSLALVASILLGCNDSTAPEKLAPSPTLPSAAASPRSSIITPDSMQGWAFVHAGTGKPCSGAGCQMVDGPAHPPFGRGSAELSATNGSERSLRLTSFQGTRLDQLTALRYNAYRSTRDPEAALAVALVLTVKFDLGAQSPGDVGQLVFDPARTPGVSIPDSTWQHWDARAGLWWATRQAAHVGGGADTHPCVEARPCTWTELLQRYPDIGFADDGGVMLSARKGAAFTGNVDSLVVGIAGVNAVFDFELVPRRNQYVLRAVVGDGAIASQFPTDTLFDEGTAVPYSFTSRAGRAEPLLVLDDTLLIPASGQIVMDAAHSLQVVSDTVYSYATLTPLERQIADLTRALLTSTDKLAAVKALNGFYVEQVNAGVDPAVLAQAEKVAQFVVVDPVRDAAAMDAVDDALTGLTFQYQKGWDRIYTSITRDGGAPAGAPTGAPPSSSSLSRAPSLMTTPASPTTTALSAPSAFAVPTSSRTVLQNPEDPQEYTRVLYMNGIWTSRDESMASTLILATALYKVPRFGNNYTRVTMFYNPTRSEEMKAWDAAHPCELRFIANWAVFTLPYASFKYSVCKGIRFVKVFTSSDIIESITARMQLALAWQPTNDAAASFARTVAAYRAQDWHVLAVGHSEGTILEAQAVRLLPAIENHPLEVANRCVTVLALAPAVARDAYGMDDQHLMGLLADYDVIRATGSTGWESVSTDLTRKAAAEIAFAPTPGVGMALFLYEGQKIHSVNDTYLGPQVLPTVLARLSQQHRECIAGSADLTPSASVVPLGQQFTASVDIRNQNDRPLFGRHVETSDGYAIAKLDSLSFRAMVPAVKPWNLAARISSNLTAVSPITIPLVAAEYQFTEERHSQWVVSGEMNVSLPDGTTWSDVGPAPATPWDGSVSGCTDQRIRKYGELGNWREWEMKCNRVYRPVFARPDSLPTGRLMSYSWVHWTTPAGASDSAKFTSRTQGPWYYYCDGPVPCIASSYLEHAGPVSVVARSAVLPPAVVSTAAYVLASRAVPTPIGRAVQLARPSVRVRRPRSR